MNVIPPLDLTQQYKTIHEEVSVAVLDILASGRYINGPVVAAFEQAFAEYIGTPDCVACNSGTDALYLALKASNIGQGDEVITSAFTFFATAEMISAIGATPVFVDIDPQTANLDVYQLEKAITPRTRAIIPVHLFGHPADMTQVMAIATAHQLIVIEDCAQATGAEWGGSKVGSIGHIGCFSFYPTKNLGACGDGGAITIQDPEVAKKIRILREHGQCQLYIYQEIGINSRLDALQAAILQIKLRYLDQWNRQRQAIATHYTQLLSGVPGVMPLQAPMGGMSVWNQYTIRLVNAAEKSSQDYPAEYRDRIRQSLKEQNIGTAVYYPVPLHLQPVYGSLGYHPGDLPVTEQLAHEVLSLPMFPELSPEQQQQVVYALKDSLGS